MKLEINNENYKSFLKQEKFLRIDNDFLVDNQVSKDSIVEIKDVKDKSIIFWISEIDLQSLKIEIKDCSFDGFFVEDSKFLELNIFSVEVSEFKEAKFKTYKTNIDKSIINRIWCFRCTFNNGFLIRNNSEVQKVRCDDCSIDYSFTFINSKSKEIEIESSKLDDISIERSDYPIQGVKVFVEKINIYRTAINKNIKIWEVEFKTISFYKIRLFKSENLSEHNNEIFITVPEYYKDSEKIEISESNIASKVIISINKLAEFNSYKTFFQDFRINFCEITNFKFSSNRISGNISWGFQNHLKSIENFTFNDCFVNGDFYISDTVFAKQLCIKGSLFNKFPSFFVDNNISNDCTVDFEYTNLKNVVFQEINFENVSFKNIDITNSEFKDCYWNTEKGIFFERFKVLDEKTVSEMVADLVIVKNIYSKLKSNFQQNKDYISSGKFYISEQEIKRLISLKNKSRFEYILLSFHKKISAYGESLSKPLCFILIFMFLFSWIYMFSGFYSGERIVHYNFCLDIHNFVPTLHDWSLSFVLSLKNIVPFSLNGDFFLTTKATLPLSQFVELLHKIINLILVASFTEAFIRYLKK